MTTSQAQASQAQVSGPDWDLSDEYDDVEDPRLTADLGELDQLLGQVNELNKLLNAAADDLQRVPVAQQIAKLSEQGQRLLGNVATFANCLLSVDSQHDGAQRLNGDLQNIYKRWGDLFEPLSQFIDAAEDTVVEAYLADPELQPAAFKVHHGRQRRHENLSLSEEALVNGLSQDGIHAWGQLYDQLSGSLDCEVQVDNEVQTMGIAQASGLLSSPSDKQRQHAWQAINAAWQGHEESCAAAINAIAGWRLEMCKQRSQQQPVHYLDAPVHMNRISRGTLDQLLAVAADNRPMAQRAARLQARAYGKAGYGPWDVRAPAPQLENTADDEPIPFAQAIDIIAAAYAEVDPSMGDFVRTMVANQWVEGSVGPHKRPGAYCTNFAKSRHPRVYMTYTGGQSDIITLAHELGHALHSWVMRDLPASQLSYGMSLAETASTFGETLVRDSLLSVATTPQQKLDIMWEEMSALTAFVLNIPARFEFEQALYERRQQRPLRPAELSTLMSEAWQNWYGESLAEPDPMFWASKLHFYISGLSFYNFPYLFGYLFSLGVYQQRRAGGADFYNRYVELLRDTGRMSAEDLAEKHLRVRLDQPAFWQETLNGLSARVDAFEQLLDEVGC
ncbi:MAG: M3 family oligoendopeptidase [Pseudomonadota bacterium]